MLMLHNRFSYIENAVDNGSPNRNKKNVAEFYGECQLDFSVLFLRAKRSNVSIKITMKDQ